MNKLLKGILFGLLIEGLVLGAIIGVGLILATL